MARWEPNARERLERAAMDLYRERGFDETAVADIAARAGLTERTFFRYFADKREVLFGGASALQDLLTDRIAAAPEALGPLDTVATALEATSAMFEERRPFARARQAVIAAHPALQERELIKLASLAVTVTHALHGRGVSEPAASLAAEAGIAVFRVAFAQWVAEAEPRGYPEIVDGLLARLRALAATT